jgi:hypothetical protein
VTILRVTRTSISDTTSSSNTSSGRKRAANTASIEYCERPKRRTAKLASDANDGQLKRRKRRAAQRWAVKNGERRKNGASHKGLSAQQQRWVRTARAAQTGERRKLRVSQKASGETASGEKASGENGERRKRRAAKIAYGSQGKLRHAERLKSANGKTQLSSKLASDEKGHRPKRLAPQTASRVTSSKRKR